MSKSEIIGTVPRPYKAPVYRVPGTGNYRNRQFSRSGLRARALAYISANGEQETLLDVVGALLRRGELTDDVNNPDIQGGD